MTAFCGLYITSECFGQIQASQDGMYNGRPQYFFSITYNGNLINGWIYWSPDDNSWFVQDLSTNQNISYLPFDRIHPNGTYLEWENVSLLSYGCLSNSTSFETDWYSECPPSYFQFCCPGETQPENYVGVQNFDYYGYFDSVFYLESTQFSGCATLIDSSIPSGSIVYSSVDSFTQYNTCIECTGSTEPCYSQPIYTTPTPVPVLTADTGCGPNFRLVNECEPITVAPLSVLCSITNVSTYGGNNGSIELLISGGTPPYTISWNNGNTTPFLTNLTAGFYQYTVSDYYGDFVFTNGCSVSQSPLPTPTPPLSNICMTVNVDGIIERNTYNVVENGSEIPSYLRDDGQGDIGWRDSFNPPYWSIESDLTAGDMVNYNTEYPPLSGWTWLDINRTGFAEGTNQNCQENGNFCMTINVSSFATQPYRIYFNEYGVANGKPAWIDNLGQYNLLWNENPPNSSWVVQGLPEYATFTLTNSNPAVPVTNQWFVNGKIGEAIIKYDNCFSSRICASFNGPCGSENIELVSGELINGQQSWYGILPCGAVGNNWVLYYDLQNEVWTTDGLTVVPGFPNEGISSNNIYIGPFGNFSTFNFYGLYVTDGPCGSQGGLKMNITVNEPVSDSDGGIIIEIEGGNQPYQYSIDNGATYQNFPIFSNLKNGTYVVTVRDVNGLTIKQNITLIKPANKIAYQVLLNTTSRKTVNTVTTTTTEYTTLVTVQPPLPNGVTITFNLLHTDDYKVSPLETSSQLTLGTILLKNGEEIEISTSENSSTSFTNTNFGCQNNLTYTTATTETWNSLTMGSTDEIKVITTVTNYTNQKVPCYFVGNIENYSLLNVRINGCSNCEVVNQDNPPPPSQTPTRTPTPTPTTSKPATTSPGI